MDMSISIINDALAAASCTFNMFFKNMEAALKGREVRLLVGPWGDRRAVIAEVHLFPKSSYIGNEMRPALELYVTVDVYDKKGKQLIARGQDCFYHADNVELK